MTAPALQLAVRDGVSDEIAYLRAAYPKPGWQKHRNYGELSAFWLQVHAGLRGGGTRVQTLVQGLRAGAQDGATFQRAFVPALNQFLQHLSNHHQIEDAAYFPKFRALDPRMVVGFDLLEEDHHVIEVALHASLDSARALLAALPGGGDAARFAADTHGAAADRLVGLLERHLADEEDLVIPAMLEHGERAVS